MDKNANFMLESVCRPTQAEKIVLSGNSLPLAGQNNDQIVSSATRKSNRIRNTRLVNDFQEPKMRPTANKSRGAVTRYGLKKSGQMEFRCELCKAHFVNDPYRRNGKKSKWKVASRHQVDPVSKRRLSLCNICSLSCGSKRRAKERSRSCGQLSLEDKQKYLADASQFTQNLVNEYNDSDAERLFCPQFKGNTCCLCIQKYIKAGGDTEESRKRTLLLLQLIKEAKRLSRQKCYNVNDVRASNCGKGRDGNQSARCTSLHPIGLGNGQKKSKMFEEFVLENRSYLRGTLKFCERGTQKILVYSNNFLHKKLKTAPERVSRVKRQKGKAALGLLVPIEQLGTEQCCLEQCVSLAVSHSCLLHNWRERVASGQAETRRVLAEMLTPSAGGRLNCYKFISMVTGCSSSTIWKVREQMKLTGGNREPPEHGLKKWWEENARPRSNADSEETTGEQTTSSVAPSGIETPENVKDQGNPTRSEETQLNSNGRPPSAEKLSQLQSHYQHIISLQAQLAQQQLALKQEQQQIEQQLQRQCNVLQIPPYLPSTKQLPVASISAEDNVPPTSVILDMPCTQEGNTISYTFSLIDPPKKDELNASNTRIAAVDDAISPQITDELKLRSDECPIISPENGTLNNFILIQLPSGSIIDCIPLVMHSNNVNCADTFNANLDCSSVSEVPQSSKGNRTCNLATSTGARLLPPFIVNPNENWSSTTGELLSLKPPKTSDDQMPHSAILDLTTIENPQKCN